jgi:hypothetical protein
VAIKWLLSVSFNQDFEESFLDYQVEIPIKECRVSRESGAGLLTKQIKKVFKEGREVNTLKKVIPSSQALQKLISIS